MQIYGVKIEIDASEAKAAAWERKIERAALAAIRKEEMRDEVERKKAEMLDAIERKKAELKAARASLRMTDDEHKAVAKIGAVAAARALGDKHLDESQAKLAAQEAAQ